MPSKSKRQHRFMAAVANNPEFARSAGVSQSVGKEFMDADKKSGKKNQSKGYKSGGMVRGQGCVHRSKKTRMV